MTNQELFDRVVKHLAKQKTRAMVPNPYSGPGGPEELCAYRTPERRSCAIGCLIPDKKYKPSFEGKGVFAVSGKEGNYFIAKTAGIDNTQIDFATELQSSHDDKARCYSLKALKQTLRNIAKRYGLKSKSVALIKKWTP